MDCGTPLFLLKVSLSLSIVQSLVLLLPITVKFQLDLFVRAMDGILIQLLPDATIVVSVLHSIHPDLLV